VAVFTSFVDFSRRYALEDGLPFQVIEYGLQVVLDGAKSEIQDECAIQSALEWPSTLYPFLAEFLSQGSKAVLSQ
jgi:hypothetical protein